MTTDDARDPVVLERTAERVVERERIAEFHSTVNAKYDAGITTEFLDPAVNGTFAVWPMRVIGLSEPDDPGSPTRWTFPAS